MSLLNPSSVAVIGASNDKTKVGYQILKNLKNFKKVYPINIKKNKIQGQKAYKSIKDIKNKVELAVIIVPAEFVPQVLQECGEKKVKYAVIISAGFKESGKKDLEKLTKKVAQKYKIRIIGPNCFGIINTKNNLNTTFSNQTIKKGNIALITQSGALCAAILDYAKIRNIGFSKFISLGNKSDIDEVEILKTLAKDKETNTILIYTEGINNGKEFYNLTKKIKKPIIIIKAGKTKEAKEAISTHTGSIAGSDIAYKTAFEQANIIEATTIEELLDFGKTFSQVPLPKDNEISIVSNAGGLAVLAADASSKYSINLKDLSKIKPLKKVIPKHTTLHNPLDLIGDAKANLYKKSLNILLKKSKGALVILTPQAMTEIEQTAKEIVKLKKYKKPILTSFVGGERIESGIEILEENEIPNFFNPSNAIKTYSKLIQYQKKQKHTYSKTKYNKTQARKLIKNKTYLTFQERKKLLEIYKIPYTKAKIIKKRSHLNHNLKYPLVLKIEDSKILHKTEKKGIIINIQNKKELLEAYNKLKNKTEELLLQEMVEGKELILGMKTDKQFDKLIMFGLGGIYTEVLKDVSFSLTPISKQRAQTMIENLKSYPILKGKRTKEPLNLKKIKETILKLSQMAGDLDIKELDINPLIANKKEVKVVDFKLKLK